MIEAGDGTLIDSIQLQDDGTHNDGNAGDSLYANFWPVGSFEELYYNVDLKIIHSDMDTFIKQFKNVAWFTTVGPVECAGYSVVSSEDTEFNPGDTKKINLTLMNRSPTVTAPKHHGKTYQS